MERQRTADTVGDREYHSVGVSATERQRIANTVGDREYHSVGVSATEPLSQVQVLWFEICVCVLTDPHSLQRVYVFME